jgi:uncharacterized membrane protein
MATFAGREARPGTRGPRAGGADSPPSRSNGGANGGGIDEDALARGLGWFSIGLGLVEVLAPRKVTGLVGSRGNNSLVRAYGLREIASGVGILSQPHQPGWMLARVAGDVMDLVALGSAFNRRSTDKGRALLGIASVAGVAALDVLCAKRLMERGECGAIHVEGTVIINRRPDDVYRYWRDFENLPHFMSHLKTVRTTGDRRTHWVAQGPGGATVSWDAETTEDLPNRISWRALPGSEAMHSGTVEFQPATGARGTRVRVHMDFGNALQAAGFAFASLIGKNPEQMVNKDLRRLKQVMETGEVLRTEGQSSGRKDGSPTWLDNLAR